MVLHLRGIRDSWLNKISQTPRTNARRLHFIQGQQDANNSTRCGSCVPIEACWRPNHSVSLVVCSLGLVPGVFVYLIGTDHMHAPIPLTTWGGQCFVLVNMNSHAAHGPAQTCMRLLLQRRRIVLIVSPVTLHARSAVRLGPNALESARASCHEYF